MKLGLILFNMWVLLEFVSGFLILQNLYVGVVFLKGKLNIFC